MGGTNKRFFVCVKGGHFFLNSDDLFARINALSFQSAASALLPKGAATTSLAAFLSRAIENR